MANFQILDRNDRGQSTRAGQRDTYFPLLFVEPTQKYQSLIGLDLGSNAACLAAIERARATGEPAVAIAPPEDDATASPLLYMFEAAHEGEAPTASSSDPTRSLNGVVVVASRIDAMVESALGVFAPVQIDFYITSSDGQPIYTRLSPLKGRHAPLVAGRPLPRVGGIDPLVAHITLADRHWTVTCIPMESYPAWQRSWGSVGALAAGLIITALVAGCSLLLTGRTGRVAQLVAQRTRELAESEQRFRRLVENAGDGFFLRNEQGASWTSTSRLATASDTRARNSCR